MKKNNLKLLEAFSSLLFLAGLVSICVGMFRWSVVAGLIFTGLCLVFLALCFAALASQERKLNEEDKT